MIFFANQTCFYLNFYLKYQDPNQTQAYTDSGAKTAAQVVEEATGEVVEAEAGWLKETINVIDGLLDHTNDELRDLERHFTSH